MDDPKDNDDVRKYKPLKSFYADVELRIKFRESKLQAAKSDNVVLVRCEPHQKYCKIPGAYCLNLFVPKMVEVAYLPGTIKSRLDKQKKGQGTLASQYGVYLFVKGKLITDFKQKIWKFYDTNKEEDGILYFEYSDEAPF